MNGDDERTALLSSESESEAQTRDPHSMLPSKAPNDRFKIVYCVFYLMGVASLLPWNIFITAQQYFEYKLKHTNADKTFENYIAIAAMMPSLLFTFLSTLITKLISVRTRLIISYIVMILMFAITLVFVKINTDSWEMQFLSITLTTVVIFNAAGAILQGGVFGLTAMFPERYTQAVMSGMGMGGTFAAVANLISLAFAKGDEIDSALWYFISALIVMTGAFLAYICLPHIEFAKYYIEKHKSHLDSWNNRPSLNDEIPLVLTSSHSPILRIMNQIWTCAVGVFVVFFVTLSCFPGINSKLISVNGGQESALTSTYFVPVVCFLFFNLGDLTGRTVAGWIQCPGPKSPFLLIVSFLRLGFIPLFMLCNIEPRTSNLPVVFNSDVWPLVFMVVFAVSNGYLGTLNMMYAPKLVNKEHTEIAGTVMSFFLTLGLAAGASFSYLLVKLI